LKVTQENIDKAFAFLHERFQAKLEKHGNNCWHGRHECIGIILEEFDELREALRDDINKEHFEYELMDVALSCVYGLACLKTLREAQE
jgi:hypothetical protein